jgi:hypothetical protein
MIARETEELGEILPQRHFVPPQIPHDQVQFRTPDHSGGKPATNRLSYGAALSCNLMRLVDISHLRKLKTTGNSPVVSCPYQNLSKPVSNVCREIKTLTQQSAPNVFISYTSCKQGIRGGDMKLYRTDIIIRPYTLYRLKNLNSLVM